MLFWLVRFLPLRQRIIVHESFSLIFPKDSQVKVILNPNNLKGHYLISFNLEVESITKFLLLITERQISTKVCLAALKVSLFTS